MSSRPPYPAPSRTTSSAADCRPRRSPPASSPAARAASSRRRQRLVAVAGLEGVLHGRDHELAGQDVALDRVAVAGHAAGPVEAGVAGVGGRAALGVDDADLPVVASVVLLEEPEQGHRRGGPVVEVRERQPLVGDVGVGLGGDGTDLRHGGRYDGTDGQELRGDGDTPRLTVGGASHDGERHARSLAITVCPQGALKLEDGRGAAATRVPGRRSPPTLRGRAGASTRSVAASGCRSRCSTSCTRPPSAWSGSALAMTIANTLVIPLSPTSARWSTGSGRSG